MTQETNCKTIGPEQNRAIKLKIIARLLFFVNQNYF